MKPAQKVALGVVLAAGSASLIARPRLIVRLYRRVSCALRGHHDPLVKHPLGGFRCGDCHLAGDTLEDMGFKGGSHVPALRKTFDRGPTGGMTRSTGYDAEARESERREDPPRPEPFVRGGRGPSRSSGVRSSPGGAGDLPLPRTLPGRRGRRLHALRRLRVRDPLVA